MRDKGAPAWSGFVDKPVDAAKKARGERRRGHQRRYEALLNEFRDMDYQHYLQTPHWQHFRKEAIKDAGERCRVCNSKAKSLQVHHRDYTNRGRETFNDVVVLCKACHDKLHRKQGRKRKP